MSEGPNNRPGESEGDKPSRREFLAGTAGVALNLLTSSIFANTPENPEVYPDPNKKKMTTLDVLLKIPERDKASEASKDVYIFLFERDSRHSGDDDLIAEAGKLVGNRIGKHWHVEVVYYNPKKQKWMAMGCRPNVCEEDFPLDQLQKDYRGYIVNVQHMTIPVENQAIARRWFEENLQGKRYSLAGPEKTNCTDAALGIGEAAGVDVSAIKHTTRESLLVLDHTGEFKRDHLGERTVKGIVGRDKMIFPDELIKIGEYVGSIQF